MARCLWLQCPGRKRKADQRDLLSDIAYIKAHHNKADAVVSLTEVRETDMMLCSGLAAACAVQGMDHIVFPWRDSKNPPRILYQTGRFVGHFSRNTGAFWGI